MSRQVKYLVGNLAVISVDGKVSDYKLHYLVGRLTDGVFDSFELYPFRREEAGAEYICRLTVRESAQGNAWVLTVVSD